MSKRRTKKQKVSARHAYSLPTAFFDDSPSPNPSKPGIKSTSTLTHVLKVDSGNIIKDLQKTISMSGIIFIIEMALYFYNR
jgi:hypothetical protein